MQILLLLLFTSYAGVSSYKNTLIVPKKAECPSKHNKIEIIKLLAQYKMGKE